MWLDTKTGLGTTMRAVAVTVSWVALVNDGTPMREIDGAVPGAATVTTNDAVLMLPVASVASHVTDHRSGQRR